MNNYNFCVFENEIVVSSLGKDPVRITKDNNDNYDKIKEIVINHCLNKTPLPDNFEKLVFVRDLIKESLKNKSVIFDSKKNRLIYNGKILNASKVVNFIHNKKIHNEEYDYVINFIGHLVKNPTKISIDEIWTWLDKSELPITEDGYILAFKRVDKNYKDCYTHTIDNSVGSVVTMERNKVCSDRNVTCSTGLHFCSKEYLSHYSGEHIMVLKIDPADIVSIPIDYDFTKGRCCKYEVLCEIDEDIINDMDYVNIIKNLIVKNNTKNKIVKIEKNKKNSNTITIGSTKKSNSKKNIKNNKKNDSTSELKDEEELNFENIKISGTKKSKTINKDNVEIMNKYIKYYYFEKNNTIDEIIDNMIEKFNIQRYAITRFINSRIKNPKLLG